MGPGTLGASAEGVAHLEEPVSDRRKFCAFVGALSAGVALRAPTEAEAGPRGTVENRRPELKPLPLIRAGADQIPHRRLGRHEQTVSILGVGGHHLGD